LVSINITLETFAAFSTNHLADTDETKYNYNVINAKSLNSHYED